MPKKSCPCWMAPTNHSATPTRPAFRRQLSPRSISSTRRKSTHPLLWNLAFGKSVFQTNLSAFYSHPLTPTRLNRNLQLPHPRKELGMTCRPALPNMQPVPKGIFSGADSGTLLTVSSSDRRSSSPWRWRAQSSFECRSQRNPFVPEVSWHRLVTPRFD